MCGWADCPLFRGPAPWLGSSAARSTFCSTGVSQEGRPTHLLRTPQTPRHAVLPPSLRPKGLGFRLLGANFLPLGKRSQGFAVEPVGAAWSRGEGARRPLLSAAGARRRVRAPDPGQAPPPPTKARIPRPERTEPAFYSSPWPRMLTWLGGPGPCPGPRGFGISVPGTASAGAGAARRARLRPGLGIDEEGGGERRRLAPPPTRPALLSSPFGRLQK